MFVSPAGEPIYPSQDREAFNLGVRAAVDYAATSLRSNGWVGLDGLAGAVLDGYRSYVDPDGTVPIDKCQAQPPRAVLVIPTSVEVPARNGANRRTRVRAGVSDGEGHVLLYKMAQPGGGDMPASDFMVAVLPAVPQHT